MPRQEFGVFAGGGGERPVRRGGEGGEGREEGYRVKMSLVTAAMERWERRWRHRASMRAVLPDPTGLQVHCQLAMDDGRKDPFCFVGGSSGAPSLRCWGPSSQLSVGGCSEGGLYYPPIPTVNARSLQSRPSIRGISRPM